MKLTVDIVNRLRRPILLTWSYISTEAGAGCKDTGEALRLCVDPDRIRQYARDHASADLALRLQRQHGRERMVRYLTPFFELA